MVVQVRSTGGERYPPVITHILYTIQKEVNLAPGGVPYTEGV
jgi:hypothetical protein